ncbi:hypothetical protein BTO30_12135 [Domibacillus antri]|uniref:NodB homology domain-containing protein n=1 Tax=Domibacillus antri TaxID=1714264 RepID=A0A1Q8Q3M5_9BACI|nr:polysaccharide deacetylase family protein [Domibacillus antri]OLN21944.1 hypothetical protein BTO30_12135 [Domibacillus antri]
MKQRKMVFAVLASLTMFILVLAVNLMVTAVNKDDQTIVWATDVKKSKYNGVDIKTRVAEEALYNMAVHYPVFSEAELDEQIERYVRTKETQFFAELDSIGTEALSQQPASFSLTFRLIPAGEGFYCITFMTDTYTGTGENSVTQDTVMADAASKRFVSGRELFINPDKAARALQKPVWDSLSEEESENEQIAQHFMGEQALSNVYIEENNVIFAFPHGQTKQVRLPLKKISPYMKKEWRERFASNVTKEKPQAPETAEASSSGQKKKAALTFDDGPNPDSTAAILNVLKKYNVRATFYVLGSRVDFYPDLVERMVLEGHEIGSHSWSHKDFTKLSPEEIKMELDRTTAAVETAAGVSPLSVRPPYGATNERVNQIIGTSPVLWSVDTLDWKNRDPKAITEIVKQNVRNGSVILMHDIHKTTADALEEVIIYLQKQGYELVTVDELY